MATSVPGMTSPDVLVRVATARGVTTLTLDSPHNRNALSTALMTQLLAGLADAVADDAVRVIVLDHTGPVFCAGADLKETAAAYAGGTVPAGMLGDVLAALWECPKPVLARVAGPARAGGLGLIAAADLAVCAEEATFAFTEVRIGVIPAVISATVLPRLHPRAAAELYLTGDTFDGRRAAEIGLVTASVPAEGLDDAVRRYCDSLVRGAPGALAGAKELLRRPGTAELRGDLARLSALSTGYFLSDEGREGVTAFREKRLTRWVAALDADHGDHAG
ncbi:enoyl-CoA hydratase family protein [Micromonospora lupini]